MKDTIKAKSGYWIGNSKATREEHGEDARVLLDGQDVVMVCHKRTIEEYDYNKRENECFEKCEVFTTQKGNQFIYWRDNELNEDYITKVDIRCDKSA